MFRLGTEEWIKKRKVEQITTKQVETRVKRQVVVDEDGNVVDDSGPQVTSNTSEDTQTKREEHTEVTISAQSRSLFPSEDHFSCSGASSIIISQTLHLLTLGYLL